ncbi:MAG TPA: alpha/beta hydrolase [Ensifer sp.]|uniref:alpha/beta fold hydrolase n=1 Tax=Ensifer sp. TaxID=1872086 RepID=UPI002E1208F0|nr:alpha/beta hydrolase [Ensifer sp.]
MLLVPGFMLDADLWHEVVPLLTEYGHGPATYADLAKDDTIAAMARRALADAPPSFVLVGFSMGGYVAREIVRQAADRVSALILIATSARGDSDVQRQRKAAIAGQTAAFKGLSRSAVASSLHPDHADRDDIIVRIQAAGQRLGGDVFRRQSLIERRDERDHLGTIACPTLVIAGEQDQLRSREEALELHRGIGGSRLEVIEKTGHMVPMEAPQRLATIMGQWLDQQPRG